MQIRPTAISSLLFLAACTSPEKKPANLLYDTVSAKSDTVKFSEPLVKSLYGKSDLVAKVKVISAVKQQEIFIVTAQLMEAYKGQAEKNSTIKYEAFLEEGDYKEFVEKDLIIFLTTNKQDKKLYDQGVRWGRTEPNVEFAYNSMLKNYILKLK
ncbi:hypothetical protein [Mucilaginibacter glaciei]|uniref:Lipoprotein n=1 Tax=Mucilaginibacter glaciei TaxID=2772109 RepID=A0A926NNV8_9SPHI|nr:hypothetical protein [Mucilaginibacter glaciei]MBD1392342.1 hypothetical protein [Mucilaginibacter glaciei]